MLVRIPLCPSRHPPPGDVYFVFPNIGVTASARSTNQDPNWDIRLSCVLSFKPFFRALSRFLLHWWCNHEFASFVLLTVETNPYSHFLAIPVASSHHHPLQGSVDRYLQIHCVNSPPQTALPYLRQQLPIEKHSDQIVLRKNTSPLTYPISHPDTLHCLLAPRCRELVLQTDSSASLSLIHIRATNVINK